MAAIFDELKQKFVKGDTLIRIIWVNVALFLVLRFIGILLILFKADLSEELFLQYLQLPSSLSELLARPWTLVTYMFVHYSVWHILFNMLWLYWFGKLFLQFFSEKQLWGLYLIGGFSGAFLYMIAYNTFPFFEDVVEFGRLMGASAAVIAIVVAVAVHMPNYQIRLLILGPVALKYIAIITILIDALSITSDNAGGHIAHLGGALAGYLFAFYWAKGTDITAGINKLIDAVVTWCKPGAQKLKVKQGAKRPETDEEYNRRKQTDAAEIDRILDKIKKNGYDQLTADEKRRLFDAGNKS